MDLAFDLVFDLVSSTVILRSAATKDLRLLSHVIPPQTYVECRLARVSILRPGIARQRPPLPCAGKTAEATENARERTPQPCLHNSRKNSPQARKSEGA
jgi:hypothetical protein